MSTESTELTGKVVNGVIVLENGGTLPDGTIVKNRTRGTFGAGWTCEPD